MRALPTLVAAALATGAALGLWRPLDPVLALTGAIGCLAGASASLRRNAPSGVLGWSLAGLLLAVWALSAATDAIAHDPPLARAVDGIREPVPLVGRLVADSTASRDGPRLRLDDIRLGAGPGVRYPGEVSLAVNGTLAFDRYRSWRRGRLVAVAARLHQPARYDDAGVRDDRLALARHGLVLVGSVKSGALVSVRARGTWPEERAADVRTFVRRALARHVGAVDATAGAIAAAILIGDRTGLDPAIEDQLQAAGTYHVIAISGGNIAILAGTLLALAWLLHVPSRASHLTVAAVLWLYAGLVDGGASVTRATTMATVYLVLRALDLKAAPRDALAAAVSMMLVATPEVLADAGFLLTVGATGAIVSLAGPLTRWSRCPPWIRPAIAVVAASVATEAVLLPVTALLFGRVTGAGPLLNLGAVPAMAVVQQGGMAVVATAGWWPAAAGVAGRITALAARFLVDSSSVVAWMRPLTPRVPAPAWWVIVSYFASGAAAIGAPSWAALPGVLRVRLRKAGILGLALSAAWIVLHPGTWRWPRRADGLLHVVSLDVGQGDATLVQLPDQTALLVDTGGLGTESRLDIGARVVAPSLWALGVGRLDALVLTHGDPDHIGGAPTVIDAFRPRWIWEGIVVPSHEPMARLRGLARAGGLPWGELRAGGSWTHAGVTFRVWNPTAPDWERPRVRNDDSVVLEVRYGDVSIVLPGDISAHVERVLAPRFAPVRVRVLKVAHHGSATSTSDEFLDALRPSVAIVSCGRDNRFGHPAPAVMARLAARGIRVLRTDEDGEIEVTVDGRNARTGTPRARGMER